MARRYANKMAAPNSQQVANYLISAVLAMITWFGAEIWYSVQTLREETKRIEIKFSSSYVLREELERRFDKHDAVQDKLVDRLESKIDYLIKDRQKK